MKKRQVSGHSDECRWAPCKTVGSAYVGSNPTPATTCGNGPWPGVFLVSQAVVHCVVLCHRWSGDVSAPRWLRTYGGRIPAGASGSPNRLLLAFAGPPSSVKSPPGARGDHWWPTCSGSRMDHEIRGQSREPC